MEMGLVTTYDWVLRIAREVSQPEDAAACYLHARWVGIVVCK